MSLDGFRGSWSEGDTYAAGDIVFYDEELYVATSAIEPGSGAEYEPTESLLWMDPDALPGVDGDPVASWTSSSTGSLALTQASAGSRPTLQTGELNGHDAVRFDGSDFLFSNSGTLNQSGDFSIAAVAKTAPGNGEGMVWMWGSLGTGQRRAFWASGASGTPNYSGYNSNVISGSNTTTATLVVITRTGGAVTVHINGALAASGAPTLNAYTYNGFGLGGNYDGTEPWQGDLYSLIALAPGQARAKVEGFLAWRYGMQALLPVGHAYADAAPTEGIVPPLDARWDVYDPDPEPVVPGDLHPTTDLVAVAWLRTLAGIDAGQVATTLPQSTSSWSELGFVQVTGVGGAPNMYVPLASPVVQVDCWAVAATSSGKPPWNKANQLAELIRAACYDLDSVADTIVSLPAAYANARVLSAFLLSEPRRVYDDDGSYARYQFDLQLHWVEVPS